YGDALSPSLLTSPTLPEREGELVGLAVDEGEAALLYSDRTTSLLTILGDSTGPNWPGSGAPLAWAGDATRPGVYSMGEGSRIEATRPPIPRGAATATRPSRKTPQRPATTRPAAGLTLLRMHHRLWEVAAPLSAEAREATQFWLAAREGHVHLFWRTGAGKAIEGCSWMDGAWTPVQAGPEWASAGGGRCGGGHGRGPRWAG